MRKSGFTLPELLVVMVIIAALAALLFTAGARAMGEARKISCASRIGSLGKALLMYASDYDGKYPDEQGITGQSALRPYLKDSYPCCPSALPYAPRGYAGYAVNDWIVEHSDVPFTHSATTALVWESRINNDLENVVQTCDYAIQGAGSWKYYGCDKGDPKWHDRHNGVGNVFFVDGHVKAVPAKSFAPPHPLYTVEP